MKTMIPKAKGLTLLELLIALAIWSILVVPFMWSMLPASTSAYRNSEDQTLASYIIQNHIAELQLEDDWPSVGRKKGDVEFANKTWEWEREVVETTNEDMRRVVVTVLLGEEGSFSMTGFVGKPKK